VPTGQASPDMGANEGRASRVQEMSYRAKGCPTADEAEDARLLSSGRASCSAAVSWLHPRCLACSGALGAAWPLHLNNLGGPGGRAPAGLGKLGLAYSLAHCFASSCEALPGRLLQLASAGHTRGCQRPGRLSEAQASLQGNYPRARAATCARAVQQQRVRPVCKGPRREHAAGLAVL